MPNKSKRSGSGGCADMTDDLKDTTTTEAVAGDGAKVKLPRRLTGLPMAVWITENDGYPHDVGVKISPLHGGRGSWRTAPSIAVRPRPHEIVPGSLPAADVALVSRWMADRQSRDGLHRHPRRRRRRGISPCRLHQPPAFPGPPLHPIPPA